MKISTCAVFITYEGINKVLECDLILNEGPTAMIVFEWELGEGKRWPKIGFEARLRDLQSTGAYPPYTLSIVLDTDDAPPETRAYLLKSCFGLP